MDFVYLSLIFAQFGKMFQIGNNLLGVHFAFSRYAVAERVGDFHPVLLMAFG